MGFTNKTVYRIDPMQNRLQYLRLDMNENAEGLPKKFVKKVLKKITPEVLSMYPETGLLKKALAKRLNITKDEILITNGSDDGIKMIFETYGEKHGKMISLDPTFQMYSIYAEIYSMEHVRISYNERLEIDTNEIFESIDEKTKIVSLLNPNNPIGTIFEEKDVKKIIEKADCVGAMVIIDEAYYYYYPNTFLELTMQSNNVILLRTFSKLFAMAGLRIGYMVSSALRIKEMKSAKQSYNINCVAIAFATQILDDFSIVNKILKKQNDGKQYIIQKLKEDSYQVLNYEGNYIFFLPNGDAREVSNRFKNEGVLVKTYSTGVLKPYIRISIGSRKMMNKFLKILRKVDQ